MSEVVEVEGRWCVMKVNKHNISSSKPTSLLIPPQPQQPHKQQQQRQPSPDSVAVVDDILAFTSNEDGDDDDFDSDDEEDDEIFQDTMELEHHVQAPPPPPPPPPRCTTIRFADEVGKPLTEVHVIEPMKGSNNTIVILLMSPQERVFEFLHVEYPHDDPNTTCGIILEQLPFICNNPAFKRSEKIFTTLSKTKNQHLLNNTTSIGDYDLDDGELLLAVLDGYDVNEMASFALPLLLNGRIQKAVKHAKRTKRGLKTITDGSTWKKKQQQQQQQHQRVDSRPEARDDGSTSSSTSSLSSDTVNSNMNNKQQSAVVAMETNDDGGSAGIESKSPPSPMYSESDDDLEAVPNLDITEEESQDHLTSATCEEYNNNNSNTATTTASPLLRRNTYEYESKFVEVPNLDDNDESAWRLPEITDYIGGKEGVEKVMFYVHAMSVLSAAGALIRTWVR